MQFSATQLEYFSIVAITAFQKQMVYLADRNLEGAQVNEAQRELLRYYCVARSIFHYATGFTGNLQQQDVENAVYFLMQRLRFSTSLTQESNTNQTTIVKLSWL